MPAWRLCLSRLLALLVLAAGGFAADVRTLAIGASAPDFSLPGTDGKTYTLKSFAQEEKPSPWPVSDYSSIQ
jgi:hypothetical protein